MPARLILILLALFALAPPAAAQAVAWDGVWVLFDSADDPELARLAAAGATLPADRLAETRRIEFSGTTATVHAAGAVVTITLDPVAAAWGVDARVVAVDGTDAPISFLRIELAEPGRGTLTSYAGQVQLERFAMLRVQATE